MYDAIVVGLGGMGSAAACHLASRGRKVLGLERHAPAHDRGSSHGESRIIRQAYFEGAEYVPLLFRAYQLWEDLERETGEDLMTLCGGLFIGPEDGELVAAGTCMYTNTSDQHFVVSEHPDHPQVVVAAGFSGHGYKFCSVIGEVLADLTIEGRTPHPTGLFSPARLGGAAAQS